MFTFLLMNRFLCCFVCMVLFSQAVSAAPKTHVVSFGRWTVIKWFVGEDESRAIDLKVRALLVDGRPKEFTIGAAHDITERTFVVQRMYRLNDSLEQDGNAPRWRWERGGWLMVDRVSGKVQGIALQAFDSYYSAAAWFRDYVAYCGISDDGKGVYAVVSQVGKRKPLLKKSISNVPEINTPGSACPAPAWQRGPSRVTFAPQNDPKFTYTVRSHEIGLLPEEDDPGEE
jgi:hypothetical protein